MSRMRGTSNWRTPCDCAAALGEHGGCYWQGTQQTPQEGDTAKASAALIFMNKGWGLQGHDWRSLQPPIVHVRACPEGIGFLWWLILDRWLGRHVELVPSRGKGSGEPGGTLWIFPFFSSISCAWSWNKEHLTSRLTGECHSCLETSHLSEYLWYTGEVHIIIT